MKPLEKFPIDRNVTVIAIAIPTIPKKLPCLDVSGEDNPLNAKINPESKGRENTTSSMTYNSKHSKYCTRTGEIGQNKHKQARGKASPKLQGFLDKHTCKWPLALSSNDSYEIQLGLNLKIRTLFLISVFSLN